MSLLPPISISMAEVLAPEPGKFCCPVCGSELDLFGRCTDCGWWP